MGMPVLALVFALAFAPATPAASRTGPLSTSSTGKRPASCRRYESVWGWPSTPFWYRTMPTNHSLPRAWIASPRTTTITRTRTTTITRTTTTTTATPTPPPARSSLPLPFRPVCIPVENSRFGPGAKYSWSPVRRMRDRDPRFGCPSRSPGLLLLPVLARFGCPSKSPGLLLLLVLVLAIITVDRTSSGASEAGWVRERECVV
mmetsp:Transcript_16664/g.36314  ORF Transcript_16664/g.36314 Transcript_16664/m.36314 type:complete len:203 (-) Transcript_16664:620-1228(-)